MVNAALAGALAAVVAFAVAWLARARVAARLGEAAVAATVAILTIGLGARWVETGQAPFSNLYESLLVFAWATGAVALTLRAALRTREAPPCAALATCLALGYASTLDPTSSPLMPALRSNWLLVHVTACLIAYGAFALAFGAAVWNLAVRGRDPGRATAADRAALRAAGLGFVFLTIGIATGAIWARQAWGSYWGWDPKETWSLITWCIYAGFLHARLRRGWEGAAAAWFLVVGFGAVVFTYIGVSFLLPGLHSYAAP